MDVGQVRCRVAATRPIASTPLYLVDDASPDPEAIAEAEGRRSREHEELGFETAAERVDDEIQGS